MFQNDEIYCVKNLTSKKVQIKTYKNNNNRLLFQYISYRLRLLIVTYHYVYDKRVPICVMSLEYNNRNVT